MAPTPEQDVSLVLSFLNTLDVDTGVDELADRRGYLAWAEGQGLVPTSRPDLAGARAVRDALRTAVTHAEDDRQPPASVQEAFAPVRLTATIDADGRPSIAATDPVAAVLAAALRLTMLDRWQRVKICPADTCLWAFYDQSRNQSRTWCSMQVCGNRQKTRTFRERQRQH